MFGKYGFVVVKLYCVIENCCLYCIEIRDVLLILKPRSMAHLWSYDSCRNKSMCISS